MKTRLKTCHFFIILLTIIFSSCEAPNREDLQKLLSPGALPFLKNSKLIQVSSSDSSGGNNDRISIPPGKTVTIMNAQGTGVITRIWFSLDTKDPGICARS